MDLLSIFLLLIAISFFVLGFVGILMPALPSLPLVWVGILIYAFFTDFSEVTTDIVLWTGALVLVGTLLDFVAGMVGAKAYGSSWMGMLGAFIGAIVGVIFGGLIGVIIGSALGTFAGEYIKHRDTGIATKATWGSMIGFFFGTVIKVVVGVWVIWMFFAAIF